jgi:hypothetical protein
MAVLTEKQRQVLEGEYDGSDGAKRTHRHRIHNRTAHALEELQLVAYSPQIDNTEAFDPEAIYGLLQALFFPHSSRYEDPNGELTHDDLTDRYKDYTNDLYVEIDRAIRDYQSYRGPDLPPDKYAKIDAEIAEKVGADDWPTHPEHQIVDSDDDPDDDQGDVSINHPWEDDS